MNRLLTRRLAITARCVFRGLAVGRKGSIRRPPSIPSKASIVRSNVPPPATVPEPSHDPWTEVKDPTTGQIYYWNQSTNETTALGAPKPTAVTTQPSMASSLGRVVAEGFAFGVGSSIARSVVGSIFGSFGGSSDDIMDGSSSGGGNDDFDEEEI